MSNDSKRPNVTVEKLEALLNDNFNREAFLLCGDQAQYLDEAIAVEEFFREYFNKSIIDFFVENCKSYIIKRTEKMQFEEAQEFLAAAYNVYVATYQQLKDKFENHELGSIPVVKPESDYREDLGFTKKDYAILLSTIHTLVETGEFYKVEKVKDCFEINFKHSVNSLKS